MGQQQQPTFNPLAMTNPFMSLYESWLENWRTTLNRGAEMTSELIDPKTVKRKVNKARATNGTHKMLLEIATDELAATQFFLGVIAMAEAAGIYVGSIDSLPPQLVKKALNDLDFEFEEVDEDMPSIEDVIELEHEHAEHAHA